jgi:hypothetical protein
MTTALRMTSAPTAEQLVPATGLSHAQKVTVRVAAEVGAHTVLHQTAIVFV